MSNIVNNLKLLYLKNIYIKYCNIFKKLENHIKNLENSFLFNNNEINYFKNNLYQLVKNINTEYNKEISTNCINIINILSS